MIVVAVQRETTCSRTTAYRAVSDAFAAGVLLPTARLMLRGEPDTHRSFGCSSEDSGNSAHARLSYTFRDSS